MRSSGGLLLRILSVITGLALLGLLLKLTSSILGDVLPASLMSALSSGWNDLYGLVEPAIPSIGALTILALVVWIIKGR